MKKAQATISALLLLLLPAAADAQQTVRRVRIDEIDTRIGFQRSGPLRGADGFKAGLWAPVIVRFTEDEDGNIRFPVAVDGSVSGELFVETADFDGVLTLYPQKFTFGPTDPMQVVTYFKPAGSNPQVRISVRAGEKTQSTMLRSSFFQPVELGEHLYLSLGDRLPGLQETLLIMEHKQDKRPGGPEYVDTRPRFAFCESSAPNLPTVWFGYNAVDLMVLVTANDKLLDKLNGDREPSPQLLALAEWVRRGGRLVISIAPANREKVHRLLSSSAWLPALPPLMSSESPTLPLDSLDELCTWSDAKEFRFLPMLNREGQLPDRLGVRLRNSPVLSVLCKEPDGPKSLAPLIARLPHGLGSITLIAFDVKDPFFAGWNGHTKFWKVLVEKLAPQSKTTDANHGGGAYGRSTHEDIGSQLYAQLEAFDVTTISFGWVALFILIYIIVVGPVDYFILKFVFKRLELTWVTFPAVVITVSLLAYFTAYAIKGKDLNVNKLDLIDIDMRDSLSDDFQPTGARVFGTTWFTIRSPRIQNYTIGIEPVLQNWKPGSAASLSPIEPTMSWLGRPENFGMAASGRGRSPGLFSRTYKYQPFARGLRDVPIPVWTTKSFTGSWEAALDKSKLPFESQLTYDVGKPGPVAGTIKNNLPFELHNVCLVVGDEFYELDKISPGATVQLKLGSLDPKRLNSWRNAGKDDKKPEAANGAQQSRRFFSPRERCATSCSTKKLRSPMMFATIASGLWIGRGAATPTGGSPAKAMKGGLRRLSWWPVRPAPRGRLTGFKPATIPRCRPIFGLVSCPARRFPA